MQLLLSFIIAKYEIEIEKGQVVLPHNYIFISYFTLYFSSHGGVNIFYEKIQWHHFSTSALQHKLTQRRPEPKTEPSKRAN